MRARNLKPGFFLNEHLAELDPLTRILFAGLWCMADRDGRLEDRPKRIKAAVLPYDNCDVDAMLQALHDTPHGDETAEGFIVRYTLDGKRCIQIVNFSDHQQPHYKEASSGLPTLNSTKTQGLPVNDSATNPGFSGQQTDLVEASAAPPSLFLYPSSYIPPPISPLLYPSSPQPGAEAPIIAPLAAAVEEGEGGEEGEKDREGPAEAVPVIIYEKKKTPITEVPAKYLRYLMDHAGTQALKNKAACELRRRDEEKRVKRRQGGPVGRASPPPRAFEHETPAEYTERVKRIRTEKGYDKPTEDHGFTGVGAVMGKVLEGGAE